MPDTTSGQASNPNQPIWHAIFATGDPRLKKYQSFNMRLPSPPRCKLCYAPYRGLGGWVMKLQNRGPSSKNPLYCSRCDEFLRNFPGGAEVEMTLMFIDVRGSSRLASDMSPAEFSRAMHSFYAGTFPVINANDGFIAEVRGDGVVVTFPPGFCGPEHAGKAVKTARELLARPPRAPDGTVLQLGIGVHTGMAYIGTMTGAGEGVEGVVTLGDAVNLAAHLCAAAQAGEALVSEASCSLAGDAAGGLDSREVPVKSRTARVTARVLRS